MNFSVLNWNIQGTKHYTNTNFNKIAPALKKIKADIFCLQEAQELIKLIKNIDELKLFNFVFSDENKNGADVILSRFPILSAGKLELPLLVNGNIYKILWANIKIADDVLKIYNCHLEIIGIGPRERADQLTYILKDAKKHRGPVIVCGDFNTTIPASGFARKIVQWFHQEKNSSLLLDSNYINKDERHFFLSVAKKEGFNEATDISKSTWCISPLKWELFNLKLDWFLSRDIKILKINLGNYISDHRAIFAECSIFNKGKN